MKVGKFYDLLVKSVNENIELETYDGLIRRGKMTGLTSRILDFNDDEVELPIEIEFNGDSSDRIPLAVVKKLELI